MTQLMPVEVDSPFKHVVKMLGDLGPPNLQHEASLATLQLSYVLSADLVSLRVPSIAVSPEV